MSGAARPLRIGFIPLVDAAAIFVAFDKGYFVDEGLDVELVKDVSWSNIRDKLAIGVLDAAHMLAPMAIASSLGFGHFKTPLVAPMNLAMNGNALTVTATLHAQLREAADGNIVDPLVTARALKKVVRTRSERGQEPLTFAMTFPYSMHNYALRYWIAAGGLDPDQDLRLVVLPPPYMVDSIRRDQVDGFCVGAPWSSVAVDAGVGQILHFGCEIFSHAPEKVLALREADVDADPSVALALTRALAKAALYVAEHENHAEISARMASPDRLGVDANLIRRSLEGKLNLDASGASRSDDDYLVIGKGGSVRPDVRQAVWIYAQMLRWKQGSYSQEHAAAAQRVFRPELYDSALYGRHSSPPTGLAAVDPIGPFDGVSTPDDLRNYLATFEVGCRI